MPIQTGFGTAGALNLHQSINTDFLEEDIQRLDGVQRPLVFDGINARDGLTNYKVTDSTDATAIYTWVTKSGKIVRLTQNGADNVAPDQPWRYNVLVDGVAVGQIGQRTVLDRWQVPGYNLDVAVTASGTILALGRDGILREYNATTHALINSKNSHIKTEINNSNVSFAIIVRGPGTTYASYVIIYGNQTLSGIYVTNGTLSNLINGSSVISQQRIQNSWAWQNSNASTSNFIFWCPNDQTQTEDSRYGNIATAGPWAGLTLGNLGVPAVNMPAANRWTHMVMTPNVGIEEFCRLVVMDDSGLISNTATVYPGTTPVGVSKQVAPGAVSGTWTTAAPDTRHGMLYGPGSIVSRSFTNPSTPYLPDTMTRIPGYIGVTIKGKSFLPVMNDGKIVSFQLADYGESLTQNGAASDGVQNGQAMINYGDTVSDYSPSFHTFTANAPNYRLANNFYNLFIHKQSPGTFCVTKIGNARPANIGVADFIREISPDVLAFECDTGYGILDCQKLKWYIKSAHYGIVFLNALPNSPTLINVNYQNRSPYSETIALGGKSYISAGAGSGSLVITPWDLRDGDIFIESDYFSTITDYSSAAIPTIINADYQLGTEFLSSTYTPLAIRQRENAIAAQWFNETELTVPGSDGYFVENIMSGAFHVFNINGQIYAYDGAGISQIFLNGLLLSTRQVINNVQNLQLICITREQAFFYSKFKRTLFVFDGSRSLIPISGFMAFNDIREGWYTSNDDTVWLTDGTYLITVRDSLIGAVAYANVAGAYMNDTVNGSYFLPANGTDYRLWSLISGTVLPMTYKTPFIGLGDNHRMKFHQYGIYLKFDSVTNTNITLTYRYVLEDGIHTATPVVYTVLAANMDANGYFRANYIPPVDTVVGASLEITCASKYWIVELTPYTDPEAASIPIQIV